MDVVTNSSFYERAVIDGFDAEALLGVVKDARFEQRLLGAGHFRACAQRVVFPGCSLDCGDYSLPIFASGSFGQQVIALALALRSEQPMWTNGCEMERGRLMVFAEDEELDVRSAPGCWRWAVLLVPRETLVCEALFRHGREPSLPRQGWRPQDPQLGANASLCDLIERVLRTASHWSAQTPLHAMARTGRQLLGGFVDALMAADTAHAAGLPDHEAPARHRFLIRRAEDFLEQHQGQDFSLTALSAAVGVGERQLERVFRAACGMGPCRWHQIIRLNQARRMLQSAAAGIPVTAIASFTGFRHLGRFSGEYRHLFGESPRDTLALSAHLGSLGGLQPLRGQRKVCAQ